MDPTRRSRRSGTDPCARAGRWRLDVEHDAARLRVVLDVEAEILLARGRPAESLAAAEKAYAARAELGIVNQYVKEALVCALQAGFALRDRDTVERLLREIDALRPGELTPYLQAHGARAAAGLAAMRGEGDRVAPGFRAAADLFRELEMPYWLAVTLLEHAEWTSSHDGPGEARPLIEEAAEVFERLQARPWIERAALARALVPA